MARLKLHFEGWVALPDTFRRRLGLERGDEIEAELVGGTIVLRPLKGSVKAMEGGIAPEATAAVSAPSILAAEVREPDEPAAAPEEASPAPKRRGRPSKVRG